MKRDYVDLIGEEMGWFEVWKLLPEDRFVFC